MKKQRKNSKNPNSSSESSKENTKPKRIIQGTRTKHGWIGYDTKYNPYGKVVIKDKNGKVVALQG